MKNADQQVQTKGIHMATYIDPNPHTIHLRPLNIIIVNINKTCSPFVGCPSVFADADWVHNRGKASKQRVLTTVTSGPVQNTRA